MFKRKSIMMIIAFVLMLSLVVIGCSQEDPENSNNDGNVETITGNPYEGDEEEVYFVISFLSGLDYWVDVFEGFEDAGDSFGVKTKYTGDPGFDINQSVAVFEQVAAQNPAGIAVAAINSDALKEPINRARERGIEVVTYDSDSPESTKSSYLSTGNVAAGATAAVHMAELIGEEGKLALLYTIGQQNVEERIEGFTKKIEEDYPNIEIVASANDQGDQTEGARALAAQLQSNPDVDGVFAANGTAGLGAVTAVRESGNDNIRIIGFDTDAALLDFVRDGTVDATIAQGTYNMGYWSMVFLYHLKHGLAPEPLPNFVDTGVNVVTQENVDEYYVD